MKRHLSAFVSTFLKNCHSGRNTRKRPTHHQSFHSVSQILRLEERVLLSGSSVDEYGVEPAESTTTATVSWEDLSLSPSFTALLPVGEVEPGGTAGQNDAPGTAQFLAGFGTSPLQDSSALISGSLNGDVDFYSFTANAGDIIGAAVTGSADRLSLRSPAGTELVGSSQDITTAYSTASPLPGGGTNAALSYVIPVSGTYTLAVSQGVGNYQVQLAAFRPFLEQQPVGTVQTFFLDFDGAVINSSIFGGPNINRTLSPLSAFLPGWGLTVADENAVIDSIVSEFERSFSTDIRLNGNNGDFDLSGLDGEFDVQILNSRDHADPFGDPHVSRIIIGGSIAQLGISTIGIAESIDVGNFDTTETGVVLLDLLSAAASNPNSLNRFALDPSVTIIDLIGAGVGNIAAHEAGHIAGTWHTNQFNSAPNIMDQGGNLPGLIGIGTDNIFGTADDVPVTFGLDVFVTNEGFTGLQDTRNALAFSLSTGTGGGAGTLNPLYAGVGRGSALNPGGLLLVDQITGAGSLVGDPVTPGGLTGLDFNSDGVLYGSSIDGPAGNRVSRLVVIDPDTGALISSVAIVDTQGTPLSIGDLAIQPGTDILFGIQANADATGSGGLLYTIDAVTGVATLVGDTFQGRGGGLAFGPDGTLYFLEFDQLHTLDPGTAAILSTVNLSTGGHDGLAVRPSDGALFATRSGAGALGDEIRLVDLATGTSTLIGQTGAGNGSDLAFRPVLDLEPEFPTPLDPVPPPGSLIHDGAVSSEIDSVGDTDTYEIDIDPGQTVTLVLQSAASLQGRIELYDPSGDLIAEATAATPGGDVVLQTVPTTTGGTYSIVVSGVVDGTPQTAFSARTFSDQATFLGEVGNDLAFEDFEGLAPFGVQTLDSSTNVGPISAGDIPEGVQFSSTNGFSNDLFLAPAGFGGQADIVSDSLFAAYFGTPLIVNFGPGVNAVGADLISYVNSANIEITVAGDDGTTETYSVQPPQNSPGYFGIIVDDGEIVQLQFDPPPGITAGIDNFQFGQVLTAGTGAYTLTLQLNAAVEDEAHGGPANDTVSGAQSLEGAFVTLINPGQRAGAVGNVGAPGDSADLFSFDLEAGQYATVVLESLGEAGPAAVEILNADGIVLSAGLAGAANLDLSIENFQAPDDGTYFIRVTGSEQAYSLVVTRNATFELEPTVEVVETEELLINGSFETGNFSGWTAVATAGVFRPWAVSGAGLGGGFGMATTLPQDGGFVAWNGFDGGGPMQFQLYQDVFIPADAEEVTLSWQDRLQWNFTLGGQATLPRTFAVEVRDPGSNALLGTLYSFSTGTQAENPTGDTGWQTHSVDVSDYIGQNVRLFFVENVPQSGTGPAQFELDAVSLSATTITPAGDIQNIDATGQVLGFLDFGSVQTSNVIVNGDFETGTLSGWTTTPTPTATNGWQVNNGTLDPPGPALPQAPLNGSYDALVIQSGGGTRTLSQTFTVPEDVQAATVNWLDRILNHAGQFVDPTHEFRVLLESATGSLIHEVFSTNPGDPAQQPGPNSRSFDITSVLQSVAGQTIRLSFIEQGSLFYFNVSVDDVSLEITSAINNGSPQFTSQAVTETITFGEVPFQPVDGVTIGNVTFDFKVNGVDSTAASIGTGGPGVTNNITPPNLVGPAAGLLTLDFATAVSELSFGFALNTTNPNPLSGALVVDLFDSQNNLIDSISVDSAPDPTFTGGLFSWSGAAASRAVIDFNQSLAGGFVLDNIVTTTAVAAPPEFTGDGLDEFEITLAAGETIQITTITPAGGAGEFLNELDPQVELVDSDGNVVAADDNSAADGRNVSLGFTATTAGTYTIRVTGAGESGGTYVVNVNRAPVINDEDLVLTPAVIQEGDTVTLTGSFQDAGGTHTVLVNWGDGTTTEATVDQAANTFTATRQFLDDNPTGTASDGYTVTVTVTDDQELSDTASTTLTVENVAPVITSFVDPAPLATKGSEGEAVTLTVNFSDPGLEDTHTVLITWGDGESDTVELTGGERTLTIDHTYQAGGGFNIQVSVTDDDTGSDTVSTVAYVTGAGLQTIDGENVLFIVGTSGADHVSINEGNGLLRLHADFLPEVDGRTFDASQVDRIVAILCEGDDHLTIAGNIELPTLIDAGGGHDHINGGGGSDILLGGAGDDHLIGGQGFDLLIGGAGIDHLIGGSDQDLLFGGLYAPVSNPATPPRSFATELLLIQQLWNDPQPTAAERMTAISGTTTFLFRLQEDDAVDTLTGSSDADWFLLQAFDQASDGNGKKSSDLITQL